MASPKQKLLILIVVGVLVFGSVFLIWSMNKNKHLPATPVVQIDVFGSTIDHNMQALEDLMWQANQDLGETVNIKMHYLAQPGIGDDWVSLRTKSDKISEFELNYDVWENKRKLILQEYYPDKFWNYLQARKLVAVSISADQLIKYNEIDLKEFNSKYDANANDLLQTNYDQSQQLLETMPELEELPFVLIDGELYRDNFELFSFYTAIRLALRSQIDDIYSQNSSIQVGSKVYNNYEGLINNFNQHGIYACQTNLHCQAKPELEGFCEQAQTPQAICVYQKPAIVALAVIDNNFYEAETDEVYLRFKRDNKGLILKKLVIGTDDAVALENLVTVTQYPAYIFDSSLQKSPYFDYYIQNDIILEDNGYYIFNNDKYPRAQGRVEAN